MIFVVNYFVGIGEWLFCKFVCDYWWWLIEWKGFVDGGDLGDLGDLDDFRIYVCKVFKMFLEEFIGDDRGVCVFFKCL